MRYLNYLKDNLATKVQTNSLNHIQYHFSQILDRKPNLSIESYIELNPNFYDLNIADNPQEILKDFTEKINNACLFFEKEALTFTTNKDFLLLSLASRKDAKDILISSINYINYLIDLTNKQTLPSALHKIQEEHSLFIADKEIH